MEMCYNGALVMPSSYAVMDEEEMTYVEGGGTFYIKISKNSFVIHALSAIAGGLTLAKATTALAAIGVSIATAIELGTAGTGTLYAGAFIIAWGGIIPTIATAAVTYGIQSLKGKKYKIASGWWCPSKTISI